MKKLVKGFFRKLGYEIISRRTYADLTGKKAAVQTNKKAGQPSNDVMAFSPIQADRFLYLYELVKRTQGIPGDIVECGVGKGISMVLISYAVFLLNDPRNIWGFDSFEGFPEPSEEDASDRNVRQGEYCVSMETVTKKLSAHLSNKPFLNSRITLVEGYFEDTLPSAPIEQISFLNLDVDLHGSYKCCLEELYPKISAGGIVTFDEYVRESAAFPGALKAINDFFADKPVALQRSPFYGKYFVVKEA